MPACTCNCWRSLWLQSPGTPLLHLPHTPTHANSPRLSEDGKGWVDGCWGSSKTYYMTGVPSPHIFSAPAEAVTNSKANGRVGVEEALSYTLLLWDLSILAHAFTSSPLHFFFSTGKSRVRSRSWHTFFSRWGSCGGEPLGGKGGRTCRHASNVFDLHSTDAEVVHSTL